MSPLLIVSSLSILVITNTPLPTWRTSWVNKFFATVRRFKPTAAEEGRSIAKKNQFAVGEINFNYVAIFLIVIPSLAYFIATVDRRIIGEDVTPKRKLSTIANTTAIMGVFALSFFLVPVTRHSILLVAMGWAPIHALRIHVWAGFTAFIFIFIHSILYMVEWFVFIETPVWDQIIPDRECWAWKNPEDGISRACRNEWYNITGIFALLWFIVLCATSLNWFRRRWYRLFYICHIVFGTAMLLTAVLHWKPLVTYILPSIVYYLAATTPTLIQALASRFRGGVKIVRVVSIPDSGGCTEVRVATNAEANASLEREPCLFVKLCVPSISIVWHPFTVYKHPEDPTTVRFLFRPVGPFTKKLRERLLAPQRPVTVLDGFYPGGDRCGEALQHDHVTIAAGGVAITPFLSMLPSVLSRLSSSSGTRTTKSITLHWVCREKGLIQFVQQTYLESILASARELSKSSDFKFVIKVYHTGSDKAHTPPSKEALTIDDDKESMLPNMPSETGSVKSDIEMDDTVKEPENQPSDSIEHGQVDDGKTDKKGFDMELARMMPARESVVWRNVPVFVALSAGIWIGYYIIFEWYNYREFTYNELFGRVWGTLITLLFSVGFAFVIEGAVLRLRMHWPAPIKDAYAVGEYIDDSVKEVETSCVHAHLEHLVGRPSAEDFMKDAKLAEAPGIFMCGPVAMTEVIKKEARKENSPLGLTRYCLYEEPFEM